MPFQSSKLGASGLRGGIALMRLSDTNWKSPSKRRSLRSTCVIVRHAAWLAGSGRRGTHSGTAKRGVTPPMTICSTGGGSWGLTPAKDASATADDTAAIRPPRPARPRE